jgi:hypothetical protein
MPSIDAAITQLYNDRRINEFIGKLEPASVRDDLKQYTFQVLLEMEREKLQGLVDRNELFPMFTAIAKRQLTGNRTRFRKDFRDHRIADAEPDPDITPDTTCIEPPLSIGEEEGLTEEQTLMLADVLENGNAKRKGFKGVKKVLKYRIISQQYGYEQQSLFPTTYVTFSINVKLDIGSTLDLDTDRVMDSGEILTKAMKKTLGTMLEREIAIVDVGEARLKEMR